MANDVMLGSLYILMAMMLVLGSLMTRRESWAKIATMTLAWVAIFGAGFVIFTFRDNLGYFVQRLKTEATGQPMSEGTKLEIPQAIDGHFYVDASVNGVPVRFLVDSGATVTTIGRETAMEAGIAISNNRNQVVQTGNGIVQVAQGSANSLNLGNIHRKDVALHIADRDDLNVLGMNYLSSLKRWGVEGRWLILES